jgi:surface antigen
MREVALGLLSCAWICGIAIAPSAAASELSVNTKPSVFDRPALSNLGADLGVRLTITSKPGSHCQLGARSQRATQRFPSLTVNRRGLAEWEWSSAASAPAGNWAFDTTCVKAGKRGSSHTEVLILTENGSRGTGKLVGPSTSIVTKGRPDVAPPPNPQRSGSRHRAATATASVGNPYPAGQCTWYAWSRRPDLGGNFGNAGTWAGAASRAGFPVSSIPAVGTIAVFAPYQNGAYGYGHVAHVEQILSGNRIVVSDYNWVRPLSYGVHTVSSSGLRFIYRKGQTPGGPPPPPPFSAGLDAQFPMDSASQVYVTAGEPGASIGFNVRFNQVFSVPDFVLRPNTPTTINRFSTVTGDFPGAAAPNDNHVGYFRTGVRAPAGTAPGTYLMQWNAIRKSTGQFGGLQPSLKLVVLPPRTSSTPDVPCSPPSPGGPFTLTADPGFKATLDAQFPVNQEGNVYASKGTTVQFGFNVRFNQVFQPQTFSLRTDTPGTINYFSDHPGDWSGTLAPNDDHVGYYRATVTVPACTAPGKYPLRWNLINLTTGKWAGLQPSFLLVVS